MVKSGIIEKCTGSPYNSPVFLVPKPNGKGHRVVNDYRLLNQALKDNRYPVPFIKDHVDRLHGAKYFSSFDLRSGFYNVVLTPESRMLTAFNILGNTYRYRVVAQGIK